MFKDIRKIVFGLACLGFIAFIVSIILNWYGYDIDIAGKMESMFGYLDIFFVITFALVSIGVLALVFQFFGKKPEQEVLEGDILLKIQNATGHYIFLAIGGFVFLLLFVFILYDHYTNPDTDFNFGKMEVFIFGFFAFLALFLVIVGITHAFKNEAVITMTTKGFIFNPAGIPTGVIRWTDILEIEETTIQSTTGRRPTQEPVLAIKLIDPDIAYRPVLNPIANKLLAPLFKFRQEEAGTHLFLSRRLLGNDYDRVVDIIKQQTAKKSDHRSTSIPPQ
jgi:cbb3-type cytochrome oxidase subunit 3